MPNSDGHPVVFSTRCLNKEHVSRLEQAGIMVEQKDFINVTHKFNRESFKEYLNNPNSQARIFTSKNSVYSLRNLMEVGNFKIEKKKNFTVGIRATELLEEMGVEVDAKAGNAISLAQIIARNKGINAVDFFCGDKSLDDLPEYLTSKSIQVHKEIVYRTELNHLEVDSSYFDGIIFLSPTAVYSFFKKNKINIDLPTFCIGATTSEAIHCRCDNKRYPSNQPSIDSVVDKVIEHFNTVMQKSIQNH